MTVEMKVDFYKEWEMKENQYLQNIGWCFNPNMIKTAKAKNRHKWLQ